MEAQFDQWCIEQGYEGIKDFFQCVPNTRFVRAAFLAGAEAQRKKDVEICMEQASNHIGISMVGI